MIFCLKRMFNLIKGRYGLYIFFVWSNKLDMPGPQRAARHIVRAENLSPDL